MTSRINLQAKLALSLVCSLLLLATLTACSSSSGNSISSVKVSGEFGKTPEVTFKTPLKPTKEESAVVIEGSGPVVKDGQLVTVREIAYRADNGEKIDNNFESAPLSFVLSPSFFNETVVKGLVGRTVGSRVVMFIDGTQSASATWVVVVFDILSATDIPEKASGTPVTPPASLPVVTDVNGIPTITKPTNTPPPALVAQVLIKGDGPVVQAGQTVVVQYSGMIWASGKIFDQSWGGSGPVDFEVGSGKLISGFDEGLVGQTVGSRVLLVIPPDKGYGSGGNTNAGISGTDTLIFVVDILAAA